MKHVVRKAFYDHEKEEKWINEMSAKGLALTDVSWCRYVFSETINNEYTYRIELLDKLPTSPESRAYINFLEENGVEYVSSYMRWIYLRKKSSEGDFDIYTDIDSKIKYYKKINVFWTSMMLIELVAVLINLIVGITNTKFININLFFAFLLLILVIKFWSLGIPIRKRIKELKKEKSIRE